MNVSQNSRQSGFTVIELIVVAVVLAIAGFVTFIQLNNLRISGEDMQRKIAINAMYYGLEEVFYKQHQYYPSTLSAETLPSVDPELFTDPNGFTLGKEALSEEELQKLSDEGESTPDVEKRLLALNSGLSPNYHYSGTNCDTEGHCKSYTLSADLVNEAQYVKKSRNK